MYSRAEIEEEFIALSNIHRLVKRLRNLCDDESVLDIIASRSYRHPNGFDKIVLKYHGKGLPSLRLHIWWNATQDVNDVHNHPWDFKSSVISGAIENRVFVTRKSKPASHAGDIYNHYKIHHSKLYGIKEVVFVDKCELQETVLSRYESGQSYFQRSNTVHTVSPISKSGVCSTLVLQDLFINNQCDIFTATEFSKKEVNLFTQSEVKAILLKYADYLCSIS